MIDVKSNKNIWVFHHYATPPTMSGFTRPYNFAVNMNDKGYTTTIFTASYLHFSDTNLINDRKLYIEQTNSDVSFVFINTPSSAKNAVARIRNMITYYIRLFKIAKKYSEKNGKPDFIIASSPHPLAMLAGIQISKKFKVPCICEIRDLWPEAIFSFSKLKESSLVGRLLILGEYWIYKKADALVFLKEGDTDYLKERNWTTQQGGKIDLKKCHYINNGVDIESFNKQVKNNPMLDPDLHSNKFNVIYTGAIRPINEVENIVKAAELLKDQDDIQFLVYGDGSQFEHIKNQINQKGLTNIKMKGYVDKRFIPYILSKSSVNILNYSQNKYNWSRGNSSNKLFEYMASGKPIISTVKMGYSLINKYNCGIELEQSNPKKLANVILQMKNMNKEEYKTIGKNGVIGAKNFDFKKLAIQLIEAVNSTAQH